MTWHVGAAARRLHDTWAALRAAPSNGEETPSVQLCLLCIYVPSEKSNYRDNCLCRGWESHRGVTLTALTAISAQT